MSKVRADFQWPLKGKPGDGCSTKGTSNPAERQDIVFHMPALQEAPKEAAGALLRRFAALGWPRPDLGKARPQLPFSGCDFGRFHMFGKFLASDLTSPMMKVPFAGISDVCLVEKYVSPRWDGPNVCWQSGLRQ